MSLFCIPWSVSFGCEHEYNPMRSTNISCFTMSSASVYPPSSIEKTVLILLLYVRFHFKKKFFYNNLYAFEFYLAYNLISIILNHNVFLISPNLYYLLIFIFFLTLLIKYLPFNYDFYIYWQLSVISSDNHREYISLSLTSDWT